MDETPEHEQDADHDVERVEFHVTFRTGAPRDATVAQLVEEIGLLWTNFSAEDIAQHDVIRIVQAEE